MLQGVILRRKKPGSALTLGTMPRYYAQILICIMHVPLSLSRKYRVPTNVTQIQEQADFQVLL